MNEILFWNVFVIEKWVRWLIRNISVSLLYSQRLDCRTIDETRSVNIEFRSHPGYVSVTLGQTQWVTKTKHRTLSTIWFSVIAQASCRITKPKESRASEGHIRVHLDMSEIPLINLENWKFVELISIRCSIFWFIFKTPRIRSRIKRYSRAKYLSFELCRSRIIMYQCRRISLVD